MSLSIGELVGYVELDTSAAEGAAGRIGGMFKTLGAQWGRVLGAAGEDAGKEASEGIVRLMESLPKNAQGLMSETSREFYALAPDMRAAVLKAKAEFLEGLSGIPEKAGAIGDKAGAEISKGGEKSATGFGGKFKGSLPGILAAAGIAGGAAFTKALDSAMDIEVSRDRVVAALDLTTEQAARAGKVSSQLYAGAWGESAADVDAALEAVMSSVKGMRNASEADLFAVTSKVLDFATAMQVDVTRAAQVAGNMVANGMAKDGTQAMDLLSKALSKVPVQLREDVMDATDEYGQFFNALGIKGPKAMGLLATSAGKGMYGIDKMGDAIKEFTIRATDGSKSTSTAMESMGLDFHKVENDLLAGGGRANKAFNQVVNGLLQMKDPAAQAQTALALFGTPLEDLGTKDIPKFLQSMRGGDKAMQGWQGASDRLGKSLNDNAKTNMESFKRQLSTGFVNLIGGKVLPGLTKFSGVLATQLGPALSKAKAFLTEFFGEGGKGRDMAMQIASAWAKAMDQIVKTVGPAVDMVVAFFRSKWGQALLANITNTFTTVYNVIAGLMQVIRGIILTVTGLIQGDWSKAWTGIKTIVSGVGKVIWSVIKGLFNTIKNGVGAAMSVVKGLFSKGWNGVKSLTGKAIGGIVGLAKGLPGKAKSAISGLGGLIVGVASRAWSAFKTATSNGIGKAITFAKSLPGKIKNALSGLSGQLVEAGKDAARGLWSGLQSMAGWLEGKVWGWVKSVLPGPVRKALGIHSPSRVMAEIGRHSARGLAKGLDDERATVRKAAEKAAKAAIEATQKALAAARSKKSGLLSQFSDISTSVAGAVRPDLFQSSTAGDFLTAGKDGVSKLDGLLKAQAKLVKMGGSKDFLQSLFASGNTDLIFDFAGGSRSQLKNAMSLFSKTNSLSTALGNRVADNVLGDKVDKVAAEIRKLGDRLEKQQKKAKRDAPVVGKVVTQRGQSAHEIAERLYHLTRTRG